jgi:hypothetical protein
VLGEFVGVTSTLVGSVAMADLDGIVAKTAAAVGKVIKK